MKHLINNFNYSFQFFENHNLLEMIEKNYNFKVNINNFKCLNSDELAKQVLLCSLLSFDGKKNIQINIKFVDECEVKLLNKTFRAKNYTTNIISFENDHQIQQTGEFGDLAVCIAIVKKEALEQNKSFKDHLSHLIIHGCLHLQGLDHIKQKQAEIMENKEIEILNYLNIKNPYFI